MRYMRNENAETAGKQLQSLFVSILMSMIFCFEAPAVESGDVLRLFYWQAPSIFNPHLNAAGKDREACRITYEPLASAQADGTLIPVLAAEIPSLENGSLSQDGRWVIWKLKSGIRWSDGHPFTSGDVLFTWEYIRNPDNNATTIGVYDSIQRIELLDTFTIKIIFKAPNPAWALPFIGA